MKKYWYFVSYSYSVYKEQVTEAGRISYTSPVIENGEIWRPYPLDSYDLINREVKGAVWQKKPTIEGLVVLGCSLMRVEG